MCKFHASVYMYKLYICDVFFCATEIEAKNPSAFGREKDALMNSEEIARVFGGRF